MILSADQLTGLAQAAGAAGDVTTAVAVALAESGGDTAAVGKNADGSRDRGLWQINDQAHPEVSDSCAFDPACNARAAYTISNGWTDFSAWTVYTTGAYLQFMPQAGTAVQQAPPQRSLQGQSVVGQMVSTPWVQGQWEVTQGWGPTDYDGEPEGHGYQHWHAGVDIGVDCGSTVVLPGGLTGTVRSMDNPGGYGSALIILIDGGPGILLAHLRQRLVDDSQQVKGGDQLATTNSTGNSTGCHLHFEVRPQNPKQPLGIDRYGTDVDPSGWLLAPGSASSDTQLLSTSVDLNPFDAIGKAISDAMATALSGAEVLAGLGLLVGGLVAAAYGLRGKGPQELQRDAGRRVRALSRPRRERRSPAPQPTSQAAESRIRPDMQRRTGAAP